MPLPFIIVGIGAAVTGIAGLAKVGEASETMELAQKKHNRAIEKLNQTCETTTNKMKELGTLEREIITSFERFSYFYEKIKNKPEFRNQNFEKYDIPEFTSENLKDPTIDDDIMAGLFLSGTAGGVASSVAGVTGATAILGVTTLGAGLLVGGFVFGLAGFGMADRADDVYSQACDTERKVNTICKYLNELYNYANKYIVSLKKVYSLYSQKLVEFAILVDKCNDYTRFSESDDLLMTNLELLVGLLYDMCRVNLVIKTNDKNGINKVNTGKVDSSINKADEVLLNVS